LYSKFRYLPHVSTIILTTVLAAQKEQLPREKLVRINLEVTPTCPLVTTYGIVLY